MSAPARIQLHHCEAEGCDKQIPRHRFMCWPHWSMVPRALQRAVNRAWRNYEECLRAGRLTPKDVQDLSAAHAAAIAAVREKEIKRQARRDARGDTLF